MPDGPQYEDDFYAWAQYQAEVLRTMAVTDNRFDRDNVVEEMETLGRNERDAVRSQIRRIIEHLLKFAYSPARQPPTLRRDVETMIGRLYREGRRQAELALRAYGEQHAADALPHACPYSLDDIFREDWYPEQPGDKP